MPTTVTRTKVITPRRRVDLLTRNRLNTYLDDLLDFKLLLLAAPAGYGKTSLLVDWVQKSDLPVSWFALDPLDVDINRFLSHFIAAIAVKFPGYGQQSQAALQNSSQSNFDINRIVTAIVNDIYENIQEHFAIVLDDFHTVERGKEINTFISRFVEDVDENCHLIISSRTLISLLNMPLMVARSMVKGLGYDELAFRAEEIQALLHQNYQQTLPAEVATELEQETEGWITGLLLSAETMWQGMTDRVRVARASGVGLYDYLAQQVLDQQSQEVREFLLKTSLLEEFDTTLCQDVLGEPPPGVRWFELMGAVLQNNLFVLPVENEGTWLRYHHLFRDFLQEQARREFPDRVEEILARLAEVFIARQQWEKAYEIYLRANDREKIIGLCQEAGKAMIKNGQVQVLVGWFEALSQDELYTHAALLSLLGSVEIILGKVISGIEKLNAAEERYRLENQEIELARVLVRRATGHRFSGNYQQALADVDEALMLIQTTKDSPEVLAEANRVKGLCLYSLGNISPAIEFLEKSLTLYSSLADYQTKALLHLDLGFAQMAASQLSDALEQYQNALNYWRQKSNFIRQSNVLNNLGVLHHLRGAYDLGGITLIEALTLARKSGNTRIQAYSLASLGDIYIELDAFDAAREAYHQAREISLKLENRFLLFYITLSDAKISFKMGELTQAEERLKQAKKLIHVEHSIFEQGLYHLLAGEITLAKGDVSAARDTLDIALQCFCEGGQKAEEIHARFALAQALYAAGDIPATLARLTETIRPIIDTEANHTLIVASRERKKLLQLIVDSQQTTLTKQLIWLRKKIKEFEQKIPDYRRKLRQAGSIVAIEQSPKLAIFTLGSNQVLNDGEEVSIPEWTNQTIVRELFYLLLENPAGLSKEDIGLILWPDSSPQQLKTQFKNALYRLRRALGKEVVIFSEEKDQYQFNRSLDYDYDVEMFQDQINIGKQQTDHRQHQAFKKAVNIYHGDYLPEISGAWVVPKREQFWQEFLRAQLHLAQYAFENQDFISVIDQLQNIVNLDPCQEEAHRLIMQAYAALGNRGDLVRQFAICKDALQTELGVVPSPQTENLYRDLLAKQEA